MKRRIQVELIDRFELDIELPEDDELTDEQLKERVETWVYDGDCQGLRRGGMEGSKPLPEQDLQDVKVEVYGYCAEHPEQLVERIWRNQAGDYCCRICWERTPYGAAAMERINEAKAKASGEVHREG